MTIKRSINGLMNRLSDATKDSICKSLKGINSYILCVYVCLLYSCGIDIFVSHSKNICTAVFCDSLFLSCVHESQIMTNFIPLHAAVVAALHAMLGFDVSCVILEHLIVKFFDVITFLF